MPDAAGEGAHSNRATGDAVTLVTGASEGLGAALAREFAAKGHALVLTARSADKLKAVAKDIESEFGVTVHIEPADLARREGCAELFEAIVKKGLFVEYLVNNAGTGQCGDFSQADERRIAALTGLNVSALTDLSRRFLPGMVAQDRGGILNVGSLAGFMPGPYQAAYYASKAYVLSLTEALSEELRGTKVKIAALSPGPVKTAFHEKMGGERSRYMRFQGVMDAQTVARIGYNNFMCGQKVIVPGVINMLTAAAVRYLPHMVLNPFTARLLKPEDDQQDA